MVSKLLVLKESAKYTRTILLLNFPNETETNDGHVIQRGDLNHQKFAQIRSFFSRKKGKKLIETSKKCCGLGKGAK